MKRARLVWLLWTAWWSFAAGCGVSPESTGLASARPFFGTGRLSIGGDHACYLFPQGKLKCWGGNNAGQLGIGRDDFVRGDLASGMGDNLPFVDVGLGRTVREVDCGRSHTCALLDDGSVKCWGSNYAGQLGTGDNDDRGRYAADMGDALAPVALGTGRKAVAIAAGDEHSCALLDDGTVKCWGTTDGDYNAAFDTPEELGDNLPAVPFGGRKAVRIEAGAAFTCALLEDGAVACWGRNLVGNLGQGDTTLRTGRPADGPVPTVNLGSNRTAIDIAVGFDVACALLDNEDVKCWGDGRYGQLGLGDTMNRGDVPGQMGDALPIVDVGAYEALNAVRAGGDFSCVVLDGRVRCWGANDHGELGQGDTRTRGDDPNEMAGALEWVDFGTNAVVVDLDLGTDAACVLTDDERVRCWGDNMQYELGHDGGDIGDQTGEMGTALAIVDVGSIDGLPSGPALSECQLTRNGCGSVCGAIGRTCSSSCSELSGATGAVFSNAVSCSALASPLESLSVCTQARADVADYVRCCCE